MTPAQVSDRAVIASPTYHRAPVCCRRALHLDALMLVRSLHLLSLCRLAVQLAHWRCPPPLPVGPDGAVGHAAAHLPRTLLHDYRVHTLLYRGSGLPLHFLVSPANRHAAPFAHLLLEWAPRLYHIRPRLIRLDADYWDLQLIRWIHALVGAVAVVSWNPKRQKNRSCLPPPWTSEEVGKCSCFGRVFLFFRLQRLPLSGWSATVSQVALTYTATIVVVLAAWQAGHSDLIRSPKRALAHLWEDSKL